MRTDYISQLDTEHKLYISDKFIFVNNDPLTPFQLYQFFLSQGLEPVYHIGFEDVLFTKEHKFIRNLSVDAGLYPYTKIQFDENSRKYWAFMLWEAYIFQMPDSILNIGFCLNLKGHDSVLMCLGHSLNCKYEIRDFMRNYYDSWFKSLDQDIIQKYF